MKGGGQMGEFVDYEYEAILKKTEEQKAIKAEEKREQRAFWLLQGRRFHFGTQRHRSFT